MTSFALLVLACTSIVHAMVTPTAPGPGQVFNVGSDCPIQWNLDTTSKWTSFSIDLKTGSNTAMQLVTNVASGLDGTKGATSYTWKCPNVTPNAAIYFYEFSQAGESTAWTTRFTIASASGATTEPTESTQPDGKSIPWGKGHLVNGQSSSTSGTSNPVANTSTAATNASTPSIALNTTAPSTSPLTSPLNTTVGTSGSTSSATTGTSQSTTPSSPSVATGNKSGSTSSSSTASTGNGSGTTTTNPPTTSGTSSLYNTFSRSLVLVTIVSFAVALSA